MFRWIFLLPVFLLLAPLHYYAQTDPSPPLKITIDKPAEQEIRSGQTHRYEIELVEGQYARIDIEQRGIDLVIRLHEPGATGSIDFDSELRANGHETAEVAAEKAGAWRLAIEPRYKHGAAGAYKISVTELRASGPRDHALHEARRMAAEAIRVQRAGKYAEARRIAEQVLEIREKELGEPHRQTALAIQHVGSICEGQEDYGCAQRQAARALRIREEVSGPDHPDVAVSLSNLAITYVRTEDYGRAIELYQRALQINEKSLGADHPETARTLNGLGICYRRRGDLVKAEEAYRRAMAIQEKALGPEDRTIGMLLNNLAGIYSAQDDHVRAAATYRRVLDIVERTQGSEHPDVRVVLSNLALAHMELGEYAEAESLFERSLRVTERAVGLNNRSTAITLHNLATCLRLKGDHAKAEATYLRALGIREAVMGPDHPSVARTLNGLAMNYENTGDFAKAVAAAQRAARITERELSMNVAIGSERQKLAFLSTLPERTNEILSLGLGSASKLPEARELAATVVLQRKGRVQDAMAGNMAAMRQRFNPERQRLFDEWTEITTKLAGLVLSGPAKESLAEYQKHVRDLEERREAIEEKLSLDSAGSFTRSRTVDIQSVRAILPSAAALLEYAVYRPLNISARIHGDEFGPPRYAAFVVRRNGSVHAADLGAVEEIDKMIARFREALRDPGRRDVNKFARALEERLIVPLRESLDGVSQLLVSPDGALNLIPFAALRDSNGQYLTERYGITYLTSGRDLLRFSPHEVKIAAGRLLIVANPSFDTPQKYLAAAGKTPPRRSITTGGDLSNVYFVPLAGASLEARAIGALFPDSIILSGANATKDLLKSYPSPGILHVATHGFFLDDKPAESSAHDRSAGIQNPLLRSGLALAGANTRSGDGILTALEASGLDLWGTKLVTLSACDTGLGEVRNGEGVYGFRRALVLAGAESLVMSLWPVSDQITRELMTAYYSRLKKGQGRGEALRQVQLSLVKRPERQHPFYWASFIQSGEWANLDGKR